MSDEVKIDAPALERYAAGSSARQQDLTGLRARMDGAHLQRGAFGYIPGIGDRVYGAYQEFVDGCETATQFMANMMGSIATGVRNTAKDAEATDHGAAGRISQAGGHR